MRNPRAPKTSDGEEGTPHYSGQEVRGGEIILRTRARRLIFFGGLAAWAVLAVVLVLVAGG